MLVSCESDLYLRVPPTLRKLGHEVTPVLALSEAVQIVEEQGWPDLLVIDGEYDLFGALNLCADARQAAPLVTVLLISRDQELTVRKLARPSSIGFFIFKPVRRSIFSTFLERALQRLQHQSRTIQPATLQSMAFDYNTGLLEVHGRAIQLTPTESRFLYFLFNNTHQVLSRRELFEALWPKTHSSAQNLRTLVSRTRHKLRHTGIEIRNARDQGYYVEFCDPPGASAV